MVFDVWKVVVEKSLSFARYSLFFGFVTSLRD